MQEINDFLKAFANSNSGYGVSNYYSYSKIETCTRNEIKSVMKRYLKLKENDSVDIVLLEHWEDQLFLENPLFPQCPDSEECWLGITPANINLNGLSAKQYLINLLNRFFSFDKFKVFLLQVNTDDYYACSYEEYLFYNDLDSTLYYLSFQVHD